MSDSKSSASSGGMFIVLKLTHVTDWSWWWVLSPSLFCVGVWLLFLSIVGALIYAGGKK